MWTKYSRLSKCAECEFWRIYGEFNANFGLNGDIFFDFFGEDAISGSHVSVIAVQFCG